MGVMGTVQAAEDAACDQEEPCYAHVTPTKQREQLAEHLR